MSIKELDKLEVMQKLAQKTINQEQASYILELSVRQTQRLVRKYNKNGAKGLISQKRGKSSNHQLASSSKELALLSYSREIHQFRAYSDP